MSRSNVFLRPISWMIILLLLAAPSGTLAGINHPPIEVVDINPGSANSSPANLATLGGVLYFSAHDGTDRELWRYDPGTAVVDGNGGGFQDCASDNPCEVADINGSGSSYPEHLTVLGGVLYFKANDGTDQELWRYDPGTAVVDMGNNGYLDCSTGDNPCELADINGSGSSSPSRLTALNGVLYFSANDGTDYELWAYDPNANIDKTNGTSASLHDECSAGDNPCEVADIRSGGNSSPAYLTTLGGVLYFQAYDGTDAELWRYDPGTTIVDNGSNGYLACSTEDNPCEVADINGSGSSYPSKLTPLGGVLYFRANDGTDKELWRYDPNNVTTVNHLACSTGDNPCEIADINGGGDSFPNDFAALGGVLYFKANDGTDQELWRYDPGAGMIDIGSNGYLACTTGDNPCEVANINGSGSSTPELLTVLDGVLYFNADGVTGRELWTYDPDKTVVDVDTDGFLACSTGDNPCEVADIRDDGDGDSSPEYLTALDGVLYFKAYDGTDRELWAFDATLIFKDGFESGDLSAWSKKVGVKEIEGGDFEATAKCKLCITSVGALEGSKSLKVKLVNKKPHYLQDNYPDNEDRYIAQFKINTKKLNLASKSVVRILEGKIDKKSVFWVEIKKIKKAIKIRGSIRTNGGKNLKTKWTKLPKKTTLIEIDWKSSSSGYLKLYKNGSLAKQKTGVNNSSLAVETVRLGITKKILAAHSASGFFKLDSFDSDTLYYIGP